MALWGDNSLTQDGHREGGEKNLDSVRVLEQSQRPWPGLLVDLPLRVENGSQALGLSRRQN